MKKYYFYLNGWNRLDILEIYFKKVKFRDGSTRYEPVEKEVKRENKGKGLGQTFSSVETCLEYYNSHYIKMDIKI